MFRGQFKPDLGGNVMAHKDSDSDIELEIEGEDDITMPQSDFMKQLKGRLNEAARPTGAIIAEPATSSKRPATGQNEIDRLFADWNVQLPYSCKLTLEDLSLSENNAPENKTFTIQILKNKEGVYGLLCKWTGIGNTSDYSIVKTENFEEAITSFKEKFYEKTFNHWDQREAFRLKPGAYRWLGNYREAKPGHMEEEKMDPEKVKLRQKLRLVNIRGQTNSSARLDRELLDTLKHLFNLEESESLLDSFSIDKNKLWLSDIEMRDILKAHKTLAEIEYQLFSNTRKNQKLFELSAEFNRLIPQHFKVAQNQMIDDIAKLRIAHKLLTGLAGVCQQVQLIRQLDFDEDTVGQPLDKLYELMDCHLRAVPQTEGVVFGQIKKMMTAHGQSHENLKLILHSAYEIQKDGLFQSFFPFRKLNRRMLWIGAPHANMIEYLSKGMTVLKTESASSVGFFGKGLYFTDVVSKAAKHCGAEHPGKQVFLLLCEVATGNEYKADRSKVFTKPPKGFHSVKGQGKFESTDHVDIGGARGSIGVPSKADLVIDSSFLYNEFAVFDEQQVRPSYLVRVEFAY